VAFSRIWSTSFLLQFRLIHLVILLSPQTEHALLCNEIIMSSLALLFYTRPHFLLVFLLFLLFFLSNFKVITFTVPSTGRSSLAEVLLVLSTAEKVPCPTCDDTTIPKLQFATF